MDGHIYAYYAALLTPKYEELLEESNLSENILAFRKLPNSPNNIHFAKQVFDEIKIRKNCVALCYDIKSFFDELDHTILKNAWLQVLNTDTLPKDHYQVYKSITKFSYVERKKVYEILGLSINKNNKNLKRLCSSNDFRNKIRKNNLIIKENKTKGIPQGSAISAFLSNIYMLDFDKNIKIYLSKHNASYYRYCDDIIVLSNNKDYLHLVRQCISEMLRAKGMRLKENYQVYKITKDRGVNCFGFVVFKNKTKLRKTILKAFIKVCKSNDDATRSIPSYYGWIKHISNRYVVWCIGYKCICRNEEIDIAQALLTKLKGTK